MLKKAVIVSNKKELLNCKKKIDNIDFFSSNYTFFKQYKNHNIKYLYNKSHKDNAAFNNIGHFCQNWFRNKYGKDISTESDISFSLAISRRLFVCLANDYRNLLAINKLLQEYDQIFISNQLDKSFFNIKKIYPNSIKKINLSDEHNSDVMNLTSSSPDLTKINYFPKILPLSSLARFFQKPIKNFLTNKVLVWPEWHYKSELKKRNDTIFLNSLNIIRGYYLQESNYKEESEELFPQNAINKFLKKKDLLEICNSMNLNFDKNFIDLIKINLISTYRESFMQLRRAYRIFNELLIYYKPSALIVPGATHFGYIIAVQVAKKIGIKTYLATDGYPVLSDKFIFYKDYLGQNYLFDYYVAYGNNSKILYESIECIPKNQIITTKNFFKGKLSNKSEKDKNTVMLLSYYPSIHNPETRWDMRFSIVFNIYKLLKKLEYESILIKVKSGPYAAQEIGNYKKFFKIYGESDNVNIITGELSSSLENIKFVIGQVSTACFECSLHNIPYYAYEPNEAGLSADSKSIFINNLDQVASNVKELEENLKDNQTLDYKSETYDNIKSFSKIDFTNLT